MENNVIQAEGVEKEYSNPILIDLKNATSFSKDINISLPAGVVAGSPRLVVTAIGKYTHAKRIIMFLRKVKSMQRSGTEAIRAQLQHSKPKREIANITSSQHTMITYGATE